ncbi:MAG: hypothetical protein PHZ00_02995 [Candidatus Peribacteraceae bacterium]|nr:hypothetical protein [Candidatus Peribacteraceae bacterium]
MPKRKKQRKQAVPMPTAQELYDLWMSQIEPELTTQNIDHADEMHAGETPEERTARYAWYTEAFQIFDNHRKAVDLAVQKEYSRFARETGKAAEKKQKQNDQQALENIDQAISTFS